MNNKIAIVTIDSINYGNRLQNYALQEVIKSYGYTVETLQRSRPISKKKQISKWVKGVGQTLLQTKGAKFEAFNKNINRSKYYAAGNETSPNLAQKYKYFVAGSDQIWNPHYSFIGESDFLIFARPEQKIAYAASFGVSSIPDDCMKKYANYLSDFKAISMREDTGTDIVKKLTGKEAVTVLDPTMLLTASEWRKLGKAPSCMPKKQYVLIYSLGERSIEFDNMISWVKNQGEYEIVDVREKTKSGREWEVGPAEFLFLIDNASMLLTDSFHGTVFSILFHTKACVFERPGLAMGSRIDTLLNMTGISDFRYNNETYKLLIDAKIDFDCSDQKIRVEQQKSRSFLTETFTISQ